MSKSKLIYNFKEVKENEYLIEIKVFLVPKSKYYPEGIKYCLNFSKYYKDKNRYDENFLRFDNYNNEGHHKHIKCKKLKYNFKNVEQLFEDFIQELEKLNIIIERW